MQTDRQEPFEGHPGIVISLGQSHPQGVVLTPRVITGWRGTGNTARYPLPSHDGVLIDAEHDAILVRCRGRIVAFPRSAPGERLPLEWIADDCCFLDSRTGNRYRADGRALAPHGPPALERFALDRDGAEIVVDLDVLYQAGENPAGWHAAVVTA